MLIYFPMMTNPMERLVSNDKSPQYAFSLILNCHAFVLIEHVVPLHVNETGTQMTIGMFSFFLQSCISFFCSVSHWLTHWVWQRQRWDHCTGLRAARHNDMFKTALSSSTRIRRYTIKNDLNPMFSAVGWRKGFPQHVKM